MPRSFYLIDGHAQIFRAYYAPMADLTSPTGEPTRATHVFTQMLINLMREKTPDYLAMAMDVGETPTFRKEAFPQYKANRDAPPEDLHPQITRIVQIVDAQGIPIFRVPGFEADDVMATIAERLADCDVDLYFVSRDKDLRQLLGGRVRLWDPQKDDILDSEGLRARKGYSPEQAIDVQTLVGDSVDNVPGVKGVGEKTAAKLIERFGTARGVLEHADELTPKQRENVLAFAGQMEKTRELVRLRRDVPMDFDLESCRCGGLKAQVLAPIFRELGFTRLLDQLPSPSPSSDGGGPELSASEMLFEAPSADYQLVDTEEKFAAFLAQLQSQKGFAFDTETTGLFPMACELVGLSFAWKPGEAFYIPVKAAVGDALDRDKVLEALSPALGNENIKKCGQNLKYDILVLRAAGCDVRGADFDSMVASHLLDAGRRSHGMDYLARQCLGLDTIPISDLIGKGKNQITLDMVPTDRVAEYAGEDADITWQLREKLSPQLSRNGFDELFETVEMPLVLVLADMEYAGVAIDQRILADMSVDLGQRIERLRDDVIEAVGRPFNLDSPKQLADVLFDDLGLPSARNTKTGRSTDASVLSQLAADTGHPVPELVLEYRELTKLKNTYADTLPKMVNKRTGRIHTSFNQTITATGRLSSSDPNLQNIPIRTPLGAKIREAFVPGHPDQVLLTADYSQVELRMLAHFCQDRALCRAFEKDVDVHTFVASQVFSVPIEEVTSQQRGRAKAVNFGIIYGQTPFGLARSLGIPQHEARSFIDAYKARYPGISAFMDDCINCARRDGSVATILGRRRPVADITSRNAQRRNAAERVAINTVVQGSAADLIKVAMLNVHRRIHAEGLPVRMLIQVHDELVFEVPAKEVETHAETVRHEMTTAMDLTVPLKVDIAWGPNWLAAK